MNYREFYEDQTGVKIKKGFEIHHIDQNRKNNSIENLIAIPKKLHRQFHKYYDEWNMCILSKKQVPLSTSISVDFYEGITKGYFKACKSINNYELEKYNLINIRNGNN